jgi:hypothetical protein
MVDLNSCMQQWLLPLPHMHSNKAAGNAYCIDQPYGYGVKLVQHMSSTFIVHGVLLQERKFLSFASISVTRGNVFLTS